ncbi:hypothetical protein LguiA_031213 [Lonicera macranthoides]
MAPEVFNKNVDVFSFAMILYKILEGDPHLSLNETYEAAKHIVAGHRPIFKAKTYGPELKELIKQCWAPDMNKIPSFLEIPKRLEKIEETVPGDYHYNIFTS